MKKILLLCAAALMVATAANAQGWAWGPKVGATFSTINGVRDVKVREGVTAGLFFESVACNWFVVEADLLFSMQGFKMNDEYDSKVRLNYLSMPVVGKYYVIDGLNLQMGAEFDYLIHSGIKSDNDSFDIDGEFNRFNIQLIAGMAYDFDFGMVLEGRYSYGLSPLATTTKDVYSGMLQVTAGWRF
ncbi:MAG: PorT family protein [Tidjanibacter sp.]|jgi:hypothetical protein|nr:PorT family protein [Tidjanibacter sp.]